MTIRDLYNDLSADIGVEFTNTFGKLNQLTNNLQETIIITGIVLATLIITFGIAILWNQRKIKKMLREMQENRKEDDGNI